MADVEERLIAANGLRFETLVAGPTGGEPVILLHGYPQSASSWRETAVWLAERGYRAVAPSLRGYSPEAIPPDPSSFAMSELIEDVVQIAAALEIERFHLVGHDWGGALAWMMAAAQPERLSSLTVLSTPHPAALRIALGSSTQMLRSSYMGLFRIPRLPELMLQTAGYAQLGLAMRVSGLPAAAWHRDREQLRRVGGLRGPLNWYRGTARAMGRPHTITVPTMYIWGRHDVALGRKAAELTARFVSGEYRFVELDAGHWIPDRNAAELQALLDEHLTAHRLPRPKPPGKRAASTGGAAPVARKRAAGARKRSG